jgi:predicted acyltransferase
MKSSNKPGPTGEMPFSGRLKALDVFRGLTVALMILVNNPGSWSHIYPPLRHAVWHGLTPTDLVFPFFLFIVGVAVSLGFSHRLAAGASRKDLVQKIFRRSLIIFGLGLFLNGFPFGILGPDSLFETLARIRIWGVLQRIAICYLLVGLTVVILPRGRDRILATASWLFVYEMLMRLPLVQGWGMGSFALEDNFVRCLDLWTLGEAHLYHVGTTAFDPEGLLSTLPAATTTMMGFFAGEFLRRPLDLGYRLRRLCLAGLLLTGLGMILVAVEPVNKQLWTLSYTALSGGIALLVLGVCIGLIDGRGWSRGSRPAVVFGRNPLVVFVGSGILARMLSLIKVMGPEGKVVSFKNALYIGFFEPWAGPLNGSLLYALFFVGFWLAVLWWMDAKNIHVKV